MNNFAKVCQKQKNVEPHNPKKRTVKTVDEELHPEDSLDFIQSDKLYESEYSSWEDDTVTLIQNDIAKIETLNMPIIIGNFSSTLLVNSGSKGSILNQSLALQVVKNSPHEFWIHENVSSQLRTFSNEPNPIEGIVQDSKFSHFHGLR